ncbi:peritrophin-48-like [Drosophila serrata]|uniref:peritrophin-48-like n=1 Tax=Drosophila serrata TaxID=7274 RepID=UPI000A1CF8CC|nr:peritrophin-48-like [Drosophila serrata]
MYGEQVRIIFFVTYLTHLIHPSVSSTTREHVKCMEGSMTADPEDCAGYYQCLDAESLRMKCPFGSYFESQNEVCVVDEHGVCPTSERSCFEGELQEDPRDSASYLRCLEGSLVKERCPSGSYFNSISKSCRLDWILKLFPTRETCAEGDVQVDPTNCAGYLGCQDGQLVSKTCPSGSYFEPTLMTCIVDVNGLCVEPPARCSEGEVKLDPNNCAGYLKCIDGELQEELCASGSYFQVALETCVQDYEGICVTNILSCTEGEIGFDPEDCAGYRECIRGVVENLKCAPGRYFNVTQADCLLDVEEVCVKSREQGEGTGAQKMSEGEEYYLNNYIHNSNTVTETSKVTKEQNICGCKM